MRIKTLLYILIILAFFFDGSFISLPIVFGLCILLYVISPTPISILMGFLAGIIMDMLRLTPIGATSLALVLSCGFIYVYRNTFELNDLKFIILLPFVFAYLYALFFNYNTNIFIYLGALGVTEIVIYFLNTRGFKLAKSQNRNHEFGI
jgi:hypothetical protein